MLIDIKKAISLGIRAAKLTKQQVQTELRKFVSKGRITKSDAAKLAKTILNETTQERKRVMTFFRKELERELRRAADAVAMRKR